MIIINDNDYSNPYGESNDNKTEIKECNNKNNKSTASVCGNKNINVMCSATNTNMFRTLKTFKKYNTVNYNIQIKATKYSEKL